MAVVALGAIIRISGLTSTGLWRDDAWTALASKVGLGTALRMSTTTPGFTIAERAWIGLDPGSSLWAQQLPLLIGIGGIVTIFLLVRYWGLARWLALTAAFVVAVSPVATQYSTHTKEYSSDFLLACFVLWRGEAARRSPTARQLMVFAIGSAASLLISASTAPVVVGSWGAVLVCNVRAVKARQRVFIGGATVATFLAGLYFLLFRNLSPVLHRYWAMSGAFMDRSSLDAFWHSLCFAVSVFTIGLVAPAGGLDIYGDPIGDPSWSAGRVFWPAVLLVVLLVVGLTARRKAVAAGSVLIAFGASFCGVIPFGTGRTDEALYPAVIVLAALGMGQIVRFGKRQLAIKHGRILGTTILAAMMTVFVLVFLNSGTVRHPPRYPEIDVRELASIVDQHREAADWVLTDPFTRYPWALYETTDFEIEFGHDWSTGFTVVSKQPDEFISPTEPYEDGYAPTTWASDVAHAKRLWYVGTSYLSHDKDPLYQALLAQGWKPQGEVDATGGFVVLLMR